MRTPPAKRHTDTADLPASLLWTHQLRREHKALVTRLDQLERKLSFTANDREVAMQSIITRLEEFDTRVGEMKGELGQIVEIKRLVEELRALRETDEVGRQKRRRMYEEWVGEQGEKLGEEVKERINGLEEIVMGLKEEMENGVLRPRDRLATLRDNGTPPSAQPVCHDSASNKGIIAPSTVSGTPSTTNRHVHNFSGPPSVSGSLTGFSEASTIRGLTEISPITPDCEAQAPGPVSRAIPSESQAILYTLRQDFHSLQAYLELGESVLAKFPRRHESKVVEAFWEGLADMNVKTSMEERMERDGWTWNIAREVVSALITQTEQKPSEHGRKEEPVRRRKKRRVIPLVWSMDAEDGGPL